VTEKIGPTMSTMRMVRVIRVPRLVDTDGQGRSIT
jgi:hypothetical protein